MSAAIRASGILCERVINIVHRFSRMVAWPVCLRAILAITPMLATALWTGRSVYLATTLVGTTGLIVVERVSRSAVLLALHALLTAGLFLLFLVALPYPLIFVVLCAAC